MAITRAQIPEQIDAFQEGGGAETNTTDPTTDLISSLREQFATDFDTSFEKYQQRLAPFAYQSPKMNIFDVASELGAGLLSTPNVGGNSLYVGLGAGFDRVSQRARKQKEENQKAREAVAMQAAQLALQDEAKANDFLQDASLKLIDQANKRGDILTFEYKDANGQTIRKSVRDNIANDDIIQDLIDKGAVPIKAPGTVINMKTGQEYTERDKEAVKLSYDLEKQLAEDAEAAYGIRDNVDYAMEIADKLGKDGFGPTQSFTFGLRKIITDLEFGDALSKEKLGNQQVLNQLGMGFTMAIVSQTKGAISNREMELFIQASPGLGSTYEGFKKQGEYLRRIAQRDIDYNEAFQAEADKQESLEEAGEQSPRTTFRNLQKHKAQWQRENPLFSPEEKAELQDFVDNKTGIDPDFDIDAFKEKMEDIRDNMSNQPSTVANQTGNLGANELLSLRTKIIEGKEGIYAELTDEQRTELLRRIDAKLEIK